ncbi:MAG: YCF48-related protein [Candidatus Komeilibacteria bacterium]|nr:YCF48-related protein [Candidatus Komeilibacteria bacterium]
MKNKIGIAIILMFFLSGCVVNIKTSRGFDGGLYVSADRGDNWVQRTLVYRTDDISRSFNQVDVTALTIDPVDGQAIYVGTEQNGIYYSYNAGAGWQNTLVGEGRINAITVDAKNHCVVYAAIGSRVYKTNDCSRRWGKTLIETRIDPVNKITDLVIDPQNSSIIYGITSGGTLFKSLDAGISWQAVKFFAPNLVKLLINPKNSRTMYVATADQGVFKSQDGGLNWQDIIPGSKMKPWSHSTIYRSLIFDPAQDDGLIYASQYGLLKSANGGESWEAIKLLTPPGTAIIYGLAVNPKNSKEIYYGIGTALYRTQDGGLNWIPRTLPTSRAAFFIGINPENPAQIYLGVHKVVVNSIYNL